MEISTPKIKTDKQVAKQTFEAEVYADYCRYIVNPEQSRVELVNYLKDKHHIKASSTVYAIIKRVEKRINSQAL